MIEKDSPCISGAKRLWQSLKGEDTTPSLSRTAMKQQKVSRTALKKTKERFRKGELEMSQYRPPEIV